MSQPGPQARGTTVRAALEAALAEAPEAGLTARELSGAVGIPEKDVAEHLLHLDKSLKALGGRLARAPAPGAAPRASIRPPSGWDMTSPESTSGRAPGGTLPLSAASA